MPRLRDVPVFADAFAKLEEIFEPDGASSVTVALAGASEPGPDESF